MKQSELKFPIPDDNDELMNLLNNQKPWPNMSVLKLEDGSGRLGLYTGDQPVLFAENWQEIRAFLAGMFLTTFKGAPLDEIRDKVAKAVALAALEDQLVG